eukprot:scaffold39836_cov191-Amphora_coffeaeformis.AAC.2
MDRQVKKDVEPRACLLVGGCFNFKFLGATFRPPSEFLTTTEDSLQLLGCTTTSRMSCASIHLLTWWLASASDAFEQYRHGPTGFWPTPGVDSDNASGGPGSNSTGDNNEARFNGASAPQKAALPSLVDTAVWKKNSMRGFF